MEERKTGTREWSDVSYNIGLGCAHNCLYCYARHAAFAKWKTIKSMEEWTIEKVNKHKAEGPKKKLDGVVMFPTAHDITPAYLDSALTVIIEMLKAGNKLLVVSKPHILCIKKICDTVAETFKDKPDVWQKNLMFRFTMGTSNREISQFWEPGAPGPMERFECLKYAFLAGFQTSISCEPMLDDMQSMVALYATLSPFVTDKVWFGKMNKIRDRVNYKDHPDMPAKVKEIYANQSDEQIKWLVDKLKGESKVAWKDSIQYVMENKGKF